MVCPNCGSTNVRSEQKQVINNNIKIKKGNGCLWWLLLGWLYILYLVFKWIFKAIYFVFIGWWVALIKKNRKNAEARTVVHICQDCGHKWETVSAKTVSTPAPARTVPVNRTPIVASREEPLRVAPAYEEPPRSTPVYEEPPRSAPVYEEPPRSTPVYEEPPRSTPAYEEPPRSTSGSEPAPRRTGMTGSLWKRPSETGFDAPGNRVLTRTAEAPRMPDDEAKDWVCPNCEAKNDGVAQFCSICGKPKRSVSAKPVRRTAYCLKCGAELTPGAVFCMKCGARQN